MEGLNSKCIYLPLHNGIYNMKMYLYIYICVIIGDFSCFLGLANLFGAQDLQDEPTDRQAELKIVENILWPEFEKLSM